LLAGFSFLGSRHDNVANPALRFPCYFSLEGGLHSVENREEIIWVMLTFAQVSGLAV
jgi:hypothetical protein